MPLHSLEQAQFDHVDEHGDLVFSTNGRDFIVKVDDELERALLEARQIRSEAGLNSTSNTPQTLPISSIQALIRAGVEPHAVAEKYGLSDALVRRFSTPVQTEKQYAIEQFLMVAAPKESRAHSLEDLIKDMLSKARISFETVTWSATRRGRDPWTITASFDTARHRVCAEWSWNMHDNTVESLNKAAQILLNEAHPNTRTLKNGSELLDSNVATRDEFEPTTPAAPDRLPADTRHSSRTTDRDGTERNDSPDPDTPTGPDTGTQGRSNPPIPAYQSMTGRFDGRDLPQKNQDAPSTTSEIPIDVLSSLPLPGHLNPNDRPSSDGTRDEDGLDGSVSEPKPVTQKQSSSGNDDGPAGKKTTKHKSKRSAVPSWDEILFG
ncbi:septation protein SepH [Bifidobacterium bohemicum]|uniref:DNA-binding protein n=1 Tax=Bifidobacterium bohemicum DSM 22767 TaxID=1437606 RepID=A0A086ZG35_9BIFI|nr:septation protein SepH [Bifidobacterium bohemicum]KFI45485.1 DNA-binding protein [Bifidobacterium bohemicum DSM 22767]